MQCKLLKWGAARCPDRHSANQDAYIAIREAFGAMTRQLKAYTSKRRPG